MAGNRSPVPNNYAILDMSGGVQSATSHLLRKRNEVRNATNATFHKVIGAAKRRDGYEIVGGRISGIGNDSLYGGVYLYGSGNKLLAGNNDDGNQNARLRYLDSDNFWKDIITTATANTRFQTLNFLDELYVAGQSPSDYLPLTNVDATLVPSTSRNVYGAPASKFIAEYAGALYAINCQVNGVTYRDRVYKSSQPLGAITFVQTDQSGLLNGLHVDSVQYLKVGMSLDIYGAGTNNLKVQGLPIVSVDKANQRIGFIANNNIAVKDNDEVWLSGRHGQLSVFWNTDYPTAQTADWFRIPPGEDETAEFTGWKVNNNRLFLFAKNSTWKWDGANLIKLSPVIGCVSHESIQCIASWVIWLHSTGVWGFNDNTGQLKFLSRAVTPDMLLINPVNYKYCSAVVSNRIYKLAVGQLQDNVLATTSTSTSSTSTSSTSTSTSSTSTSSTSISTTTGTTTLTTTTSTSTSSTSTSISTSSTSFSSTSSSLSSTSSSISSTSISSTSTSISSSTSISTTTSVSFTTSTSSTSTSTSLSSTSSSISTSSTSSTSSSTSTSSTTTTTQPTGKNCVRFCYDFDLNIWWKELHTREQRFQFIHEMNGLRKPYFTDENGYMFRDETGFTDSGNSIPMVIEIGRVNCGADQDKAFLSAQFNSENARGGIIEYSLDGGDFQTLGQIKDNIQDLPFPQAQQLVQGRDIDFRFVHNDFGDPPVFNGGTIYFTITESIVNELGQRL